MYTIRLEDADSERLLHHKTFKLRIRRSKDIFLSANKYCHFRKKLCSVGNNFKKYSETWKRLFVNLSVSSTIQGFLIFLLFEYFVIRNNNNDKNRSSPQQSRVVQRRWRWREGSRNPPTAQRLFDKK